MSDEIQDLEARLAAGDPHDPAGRVDALNALAWAIRSSDTRRALALSEEAERLSRSVTYTRGLAYSLLNAAVCHIRLADRESAMARASTALPLFAQVDDPAGEATALTTMGNAHYLAGEFAEALDYYARGLSGRKRIGDRLGQASTLMNIGNIYEKLGDYPRALDHYVPSLQIRQAMDDQHGAAMTLVNIGIVYENTGDSTQALAAFQEGLQIFERLGDRIAQVSCRNNIGHVLTSRGECAEALAYYLQAHRSAEEIGDRANLALTATNIGEIYDLLGDGTAAMSYATRGVTIARDIENPLVEAAALWSLGRVALHSQRRAQGIEHLQQGLAIAEGIGAREWMHKTHEALAEAYEQGNDAARALAHYKKFHRVWADVFAEEADRRTRTLMAQFQVEKAQKEAEIYRLKTELIRGLFGRYVSPQVADYAIEHGAELGGQSIAATVLFADIRGFTSLTERMEPEALIALLNRYFEAMSAVVNERGGLVNKFGGDSLLAIFGTPLNPMDDHASRAVETSRAMLETLAAFNVAQELRDEPTLRIGIGIATGPVVAGNVGSEERLEYTVLGDTVNLSSRLQAMTREMDATVLMNEATAEAVRSRAPLQPMGSVAVRGKQDPLPVYALIHPISVEGGSQ